MTDGTCLLAFLFIHLFYTLLFSSAKLKLHSSQSNASHPFERLFCSAQHIRPGQQEQEDRAGKKNFIMQKHKPSESIFYNPFLIAKKNSHDAHRPPRSPKRHSHAQIRSRERDRRRRRLPGHQQVCKQLRAESRWWLERHVRDFSTTKEHHIPRRFRIM